ncbi:hypothetical protein GH714_009621 [Hevea brasiliensis]|uniref:Cytochrome P450 n=1 Tax=Hevea brasiliensis TaxID=3981 RepID=A0A6A6M556_HEVBR|nr:hypothetical protein GH714_009621 [Hevea brasiliensis]
MVVLGFLPFVLPLILGLGFAFGLPRLLIRNKPANLPNGTMGWPLCGETLAFLKPHRSNSMGTFLQERCSRYGKVFKSHLFGSPAIVSCDHEFNMFILQNEGKLFEASYPTAMHGILGKFSLLLVSGDLHKKLRSIAVSFITVSKSSPSFLHCVEKFAMSMMESWKECKEIAFHKEVRKFTLNLVVKTLLSIEPEEPVASKILKDFRTYMKGFVSLPLNFPGSPYTKAVKRLSDDETVSIVLDILLGGYETTSTIISLVVYFLGHAPAAFESLKKEHEAIRRSKEDGKPLDWEDYQKMEFTNNVISETMRCGNVVKFVHRKALEDVKYKGYIVPSGWKVLPVFTGAHFDASLHENPFEFNPWRWSTDKATSKKVMPFGGGPRLCPGAELAKVETAFFLHHLVLHYRWEIKADDFPIAYPYVEFQRGLLLEIEPAEIDDISYLGKERPGF